MESYSSKLGKAETRGAYLCPENLAVQVVPQILNPLICQICLGIVNRPVECEKCQTLFCEHQIKEQKEQKCPLCRQGKWRGGNSIHKSYRSALSNLSLRCTAPGCLQKEPLSYEKYVKHLQQECKGSSTLVGPQPFKAIVNSAPPPSQPYLKYYYKSEEKPPQPYSQSQNATFNMNVQRKNMKFEVQDTYHIDLIAMTQQNIYTSYKRGIVSEVQASHHPRAWWFVEADGNPYHALESEASEIFQKHHQAFLSGHGNGRFTYNFMAWSYEVDLNCMMQTNVKSKRQRKLFRAVI